MAVVRIGGDPCAVGRSERHFVDGDAEGIFNDLREEFDCADVSLVNLE